MYYVDEPDFFAFASEQKALLKLPIQREINKVAVADFLRTGKVETDGSCMIQAIQELLPSHNFIFDLSKKSLQIQRYYSLQYANITSKFNNISDEIIIANIRSKIFNSIKLRLRADVPVGFCLSGGIDSSSIVGVAKSLIGESSELHAFTSVYNDKDFDESLWAKYVVDKHQLQWHQAVCSPDDLLSNLETIIYYQDSPLFSTSTYAQNAVMKKAHEIGIPILLDGQGGDELFAGYIPFYISFYTELIRKGQWDRLINEWNHLSSSPLNTNILLKSLLKILLDKILPASFRKSFYKNIHSEIRWMNPDLGFDSLSKYRLMPQYESGGMNHLLHEYFTSYFLKNLLRWEDRCSMQYSIESRTPFADDIDLIEYVFSLPSSYKISKGQSKSLLRNSLADVLPQPVYQRTDKMGFSTPQQKWLVQQQGEIKTLLLDLAHLDNNNWVDTQDILTHWNEIFSYCGKSSEQDLIWRYTNYLIWLKSIS
jgi:asparagine synthase (glutamine-hydrolysing)